MGLPKDMQHVSRREIFTSLPARIQYLQSFLEFTSDDVEALRMGQKYIKTVIPAIVNIVYKKLLRYDITARAFTTRDTRNEEDTEEYVSEESEQIKHRKMFLRWYLTKLNSDPSKMEYWEYLDKVGLMHVGLGRRNPLHIDYVFLGACLGFIQDSLFEAILSHPRLDIANKIAIVKALGKVIWIQNDLFAKWHCTDGKEYDGEDSELEQLNVEDEKEGYLHGKKILGGGEINGTATGDNASDSDDASTVVPSSTIGRIREEVEMRQQQAAAEAAADDDTGFSRCPFSGMCTVVDGQRGTTTRPHRTRAADSNGGSPPPPAPHSSPRASSPKPARPCLHPHPRSKPPPSSDQASVAIAAAVAATTTHQQQERSERPPSPPPKSPRHQSPPKSPDLLSTAASKVEQQQQQQNKKKDKRESMIPRLHVENGKVVGKEQLVGRSEGLLSPTTAGVE